MLQNSWGVGRLVICRTEQRGHLGHALSDNWHGLIVGVLVTEANGTAERAAAVDLLDTFRDRTTVGMGKGYDAGDILLALEGPEIEQHAALAGRGCESGGPGQGGRPAPAESLSGKF